MRVLARLKPSRRRTFPWFQATKLNTIHILSEQHLITFAGRVREPLRNCPSLFALPLPCSFLTLCFRDSPPTIDIESNINHVEYDLDDEDEVWLARLARDQRLSIGSDDFEYLIDFLEKQEFLYPMLKLNLEKAAKEVRPDLISALRLVHDYWRQKLAERGGRPLLRRFLNHGAEKQPFAAFGVKMIPPPTQQKKRAPIEDERAYARLCYVQAQFVQVRLLLARILQREELKREKVRLTQTVLELLVHHKHGGGHGNTPGSGLLATTAFASPATGSFLHANSLSQQALAQAIPAAAAYAAQLAEAQAAAAVPPPPSYPVPGLTAAGMSGPTSALSSPHHPLASPLNHPHGSPSMQVQHHQGLTGPSSHQPMPGKRPHSISVGAPAPSSPVVAAGSASIAGGPSAMAGTSASPVGAAKATGTPRGRVVLKASAATIAAARAQQAAAVAAQQGQHGMPSPTSNPHMPMGNGSMVNGGAMNPAMMVHPGAAHHSVPPMSGYHAANTLSNSNNNHLASSGAQSLGASNPSIAASPRSLSPYPQPVYAGSPRSPLPPGYQPPSKITAATSAMTASPRNLMPGMPGTSGPLSTASPRSPHVSPMPIGAPSHYSPHTPASMGPEVILIKDPAVDEDRGVRLEGEFALNPDNLLRGYPFIGGMKKPSDSKNANTPSNGKRSKGMMVTSSPPARQPNIGLTNAATAAANAANAAKKASATQLGPLPFSSSQNSPFFDPLTGARYDEYAVQDEDVLVMEELELECEEDEEDALISNLEQTIAGSALPASFLPLVEPNRGASDSLMYKQGFAAQDVDYNPTDTLLRWNKSDLSYLRKEWLESANNPYNLPSFASSLPQAPPATSQAAPAPTAPVSARQIPNGATAPPSRAVNPSQQVSGPTQVKKFVLPVVEPLMLPATLPGYHVFSTRPAMSGPLPPRRYQLKTNITPNTVNGLPYATWLNGAQMPVGVLGSVPEKDFSRPLPRHDDFRPISLDASMDLEAYSEESQMNQRNSVKKFKLANGEMSFDLVDPHTFSEAIPEAMFLTAENSSYNMVDLGREGLGAVRARQRIDRFGRVVWDVIPSSYFDEVEKDDEAREAVRDRILAERAAIQAANRALLPPNEVESANASNESSSSSGSSSTSYDASSPVNHLSSPSMSSTTIGKSLSNGTAALSQTGSDFDLSSIMANSMNSTVSSEPNSLDAVSGETTIANGSCSHSPYETSPNSGLSPMSGKITSLETNSHVMHSANAHQHAIPANSAVFVSHSKVPSSYHPMAPQEDARYQNGHMRSTHPNAPISGVTTAGSSTTHVPLMNAMSRGPSSSVPHPSARANTMMPVRSNDPSHQRAAAVRLSSQSSSQSSGESSSYNPLVVHLHPGSNSNSNSSGVGGNAVSSNSIASAAAGGAHHHLFPGGRGGDSSRPDLIIHDPHADVLNTSHMMLDVPLTENLEDMPWL